MKNSKGFTLIELLAVIVILAIIALIATPIVLNIISDTKKSASLRSGEFYLEAVEQAISKEMIYNPNFKAKECRIEEDGNLLCSSLGFSVCESIVVDGDSSVTCGSDKQYLTNIKIEVSGEKPAEGIIELNNGRIEDVDFTLNNKSIVINENKLVHEDDAEVIYEKRIPAGKQANIPNIFESDALNTIYNVTIADSEFGEITLRATQGEENGIKYLNCDGLAAFPLNQDFGVSENDVYIKIEKTNQKLEEYGVAISPKYMFIFSKHFVPGNIEISILDENGVELYNIEINLSASLTKGYVINYFSINDTFYNMIKENKKLYIRMEQEIDGKKIIKQYGGTTPKYQATHPYYWNNDSYYWGTNFHPDTSE